MNSVQPIGPRPAARPPHRRHRFARAVALAAIGLSSVACGRQGGAATPASGGGAPPTEGAAAEAAATTAMSATSAPTSPSVLTPTAVLTPSGKVGATEEPADRTAVLAEMIGVPSVTVVEDWSAFGGADAVEDAISRNLGQGENTMDLSLSAAAGSALPPGDMLSLAYDIGAAAPDDFVGFNRDLQGPADWSGAAAIAMWLDGAAAPDVDLVFQFRERSGEVWRHEGSIAAPAGAMPAPAGGLPQVAVLKLDKGTFERTDWSTAENDEIDLRAIDQYGVYVGHRGAGKAGVVGLGPIVLLK